VRDSSVKPGDIFGTGSSFGIICAKTVIFARLAAYGPTLRHEYRFASLLFSTSGMFEIYSIM
jgi:hypothetical protein